MKTKLEIEIPESQIQEEIKKRMKSLTSENSKLKSKVKQLEDKIKLDAKLVATCLKIYNEVKEIGNFHDGHGCYGDNCPCV